MMQFIPESPHDPVLAEDLMAVCDASLPWESLKNSHILVTGATGLVGSMLVKALLTANRVRGLDLTVYALIRNPQKAAKLYGDLAERKELVFVTGDLCDPDLKIAAPLDYIFHGAAITTSKIMVTRPVETLKTALQGTETMLELAKEKQVKGMVYISSMEAFGRPDPTLAAVREEDLGYVDLTNVRSCYPEGKRVCELMCACYASEYGVPVKSARLAQTFGAGVDISEGRVFAQFTKSAMAGEDIVLHTAGRSIGNYCYTADVITGLLTILLKGENGGTYTVANPRTATRICDMAQMVADKIGGGKSRVVFDIPEDAMKYGYAPDVVMHLNSDKLQALGWQPRTDLPQMYERLAASFAAQAEEKDA